jgi:hypothetical protein
MILVRVLLNALIMAAEIAAVVGIAIAAYHYPFAFAALTATLSFTMGLALETKRLRNEVPFYFSGGKQSTFLFIPFVGFLEALMKGVLAGLAAIFTFAGTDNERLYFVAILFAVTVYAGAATLRMLSVNLSAQPARWGFFRLAPPLGLIFSAGVTVMAANGLISTPSVGDIGWKIVWELPPSPSVSQVSELFFQIKQAFDNFIVALLSAVIEKEWATLAGVIVSVNVLAGFVASVYAAIIASVVQSVEEIVP